jgi:hypothetical protein
VAALGTTDITQAYIKTRISLEKFSEWPSFHHTIGFIFVPSLVPAGIGFIVVQVQNIYKICDSKDNQCK